MVPFDLDVINPTITDQREKGGKSAQGWSPQIMSMKTLMYAKWRRVTCPSKWTFK